METIVSRLPFEQHNYRFKKLIGLGTFSFVIEVESIQYMTVFAAKFSICDDSVLNSEGDLVDAELAALVSLDHPNIIKVYNYFFMENFLVLVLDYCPGGTLLDLVTRKETERLPLPDCFVQVVRALEYCHSLSISHRDIKPSNIFIDPYGRVQLADFGLCVIHKYHEGQLLPCGSIFFAAPEMFSNSTYDPFKADVYSLGVTFYQVASGVPHCNEQLFKPLTDSSILFPNNIPPRLQSLILRMTDRDPQKRPSMSEILYDPFFQKHKIRPPFFSIRKASSSRSHTMLSALAEGIDENDQPRKLMSHCFKPLLKPSLSTNSKRVAVKSMVFKCATFYTDAQIEKVI